LKTVSEFLFFKCLQNIYGVKSNYLKIEFRIEIISVFLHRFPPKEADI
jgi:hypothetical protein